MRLAEKRDVMTDEDTPDCNDLVVRADKPKAPPAASLTAELIQRGQDSGHDEQVEPIEHQAVSQVIEQQPMPQETELELMLEEAEYKNLPAVSEEPVGARAQQALLEEAFADPEPVAATSPIERSEFQSARDSAAGWSSRNSPSASFWERVVKDVSIFTIVFAVLVFAILQTM